MCINSCSKLKLTCRWGACRCNTVGLSNKPVASLATGHLFNVGKCSEHSIIIFHITTLPRTNMLLTGHMLTCMHVSMPVGVHVCMCVSVMLVLCVCACVCICVCMCECVQVSTPADVHMNVSVCAYIFIQAASHLHVKYNEPWHMFTCLYMQALLEHFFYASLNTADTFLEGTRQKEGEEPTHSCQFILIQLWQQFKVGAVKRDMLRYSLRIQPTTRQLNNKRTITN